MTTAKRDTYTPETLLSVAVQVFNERGYDGTSMEHLSKAAGISKSSIYHHVAGKEELLRRAVSRALDGLFGILDEEHAREGRAVRRLEYVVRRMVEVLTAELPYVTLLLRVRGNTATERWALERRREFDHRVAELLKAAAADGDVRGDVEVRLATRLVFGMINSIVEWYRPEGRGIASGKSPTPSCSWSSPGCAATAEAGRRAPCAGSALRFQVLFLEHQQCACAEHFGDRLEPGEDQFAQRPVVGGCAPGSSTSKSPPTRAMWEAPGSMRSCSRTVRQEFWTILRVMYAEVLWPRARGSPGRRNRGSHRRR